MSRDSMRVKDRRGLSLETNVMTLELCVLRGECERPGDGVFLRAVGRGTNDGHACMGLGARATTVGTRKWQRGKAAKRRTAKQTNGSGRTEAEQKNGAVELADQPAHVR